MTAVAVALFSILFASFARAQSPAPAKPPGPLRVSTRLIAPFVVKEKGELTGFSIDLWRSIAVQTGIQSEFSVQTSLPDMLTEVKSGKSDLGVAAVSITAKREDEYDFSQPIFESGLQIMVPGQGSSTGLVPSFLAFILSRGFLELLGILILLIPIPAHIVWLVERRHNDGIVPRKYFPGIFRAAWWTAATIGGQANETLRSPIGRIVSLLWMFVGLIFVAYFTASVTTSLTLQGLRGEIAGPRDLPGKQVATILGSTSATYLREQNVQTLEFNQIEEAYKALADKKVNAVVYDAPILLYYASHEGKGKVDVVGPVFRKENYGIIFPRGSPYLKRVNAALLTLKENGSYEALYQKWFGSK
jgi:polar amino acid transport system substrate-binding protein